MTEPDFDRIELTFKQYAAQAAVDEDLFLRDLDARLQREVVFCRLLFQLRTKVLTHDLPPQQLTQRTRVTFEVPTSTWQMWKKRHARRWYARRLVARWPVRYGPDPDGRGQDAVCTFNLERWRAYPRATVHLPEDRFGGPVHFHAVRDVRWEMP